VCVYGLVFNIGKRRARSVWLVSIESKGLSERKRSGRSTKIPGNSLDLGVERERWTLIGFEWIEVAEVSVAAQRAPGAEQSLIRLDRPTSSKRVHGRK